MRYPPQQAAIFMKEVRRVLDQPDTPDIQLRNLWMTLIFLRNASIANDLKQALGGRVFSGPFKGMKLVPEAMNSASTPHMLGCYEHELHATMERVIADGYEKILNIGCSFGYYSVGLALRMPHVSIEAYDIDPDARAACRHMAEMNNVTDRVSVGGEFRGEDFARYAGKKTLALVDIEGAERALLDPIKYPALLGMDLIIEMHDIVDRGISKLILERFSPTHECEVVRNRSILFPLDEIFGDSEFIEPFDELIAAWESRNGSTPWAVMRAKK